MAILDDVKCPRCDRKYSGVRSRCPYCGARRIGFGKYTKDNDNAKGKMLISVLILAVFTVAAAIMLFSSPPDAVNTPAPPPTEAPEDNILLSIEEPTPTPTPIETPTPAPTVESIAVMYGGNPLQHGLEFTQKAGTSDNSFNVKVEPPGLDIDVLIESENNDVFTIERVYGGRENGFEVTTTGSKGDWAYLLINAGEKDLRVKVIVS